MRAVLKSSYTDPECPQHFLRHVSVGISGYMGRFQGHEEEIKPQKPWIKYKIQARVRKEIFERFWGRMDIWHPFIEVNSHVGWVELEICTLFNSHVINVPANLIHCGHIPGTALSASSSASHKKLEHLSTVVNLMPCHTIVWLFFKNLLIVPWLFSFTSICSSARSRFEWWGHIIFVSTLRKWVLFWAILAMHGLWYF